MLSRPRNPPSNRLLPSESLRLTHQVKLRSSLCRIRSRKSRSRPPSISNTCSAAHACTGGFTSPKAHSYAGSCPLGCMYHSRQSRRSCDFANSGSTWASDDAVEREVPGGIPRVLPRVRHRDDVAVVEMRPVGVASEAPLRRRGRPGRIALEPAQDVVVVELLRPQHPCERLPQHARLVGRRARRGQLREELVRLALALRHHRVEVGAQPAVAAQPQLHDRGRPRVDRQPVVERGLRPGLRRVDGGGAGDDVVVDPVLRVRRRRRDAEQPLEVGLVLAEERLRGTARRKAHRPERGVPGNELTVGERDRRRGRVEAPRPGVAKPQRRQHVDRRGLRPRVAEPQPHENVLR